MYTQDKQRYWVVVFRRQKTKSCFKIPYISRDESLIQMNAINELESLSSGWEMSYCEISKDQYYKLMEM